MNNYPTVILLRKFNLALRPSLRDASCSSKLPRSVKHYGNSSLKNIFLELSISKRPGMRSQQMLWSAYSESSFFWGGLARGTKWGLGAWIPFAVQHEQRIKLQDCVTDEPLLFVVSGSPNIHAVRLGWQRGWASRLTKPHEFTHCPSWESCFLHLFSW